jgi:hypothetical protein
MPLLDFIKTTTPPVDEFDPKKAMALQKATFSSYIKSPEYKKRLVKQGVKNPESVIKQRLKKLDEIEYSAGPAGLMYMFTNPKQTQPIPALSIKETSSPYTKMHELSHVTNYGDMIFSPERAASNMYLTAGDEGTSTGKGMSVDEYLYVINKSNVNPEIKKKINQNAEKNKKQGLFANPVEGTGIAGDEHYYNPSEFKSDLDAVRLLLNDAGLTKKFGESITEEVINKAMKDPKVSKEEHFIRMIKNFSKKGLIDVNNNIAIAKSPTVNSFV